MIHEEIASDLRGLRNGGFAASSCPPGCNTMEAVWPGRCGPFFWGFLAAKNHSNDGKSTNLKMYLLVQKWWFSSQLYVSLPEGKLHIDRGFVGCFCWGEATRIIWEIVGWVIL